MGRIRNNVVQRSIARSTDHVQFFTSSTLRDTLQSEGISVDRLVGETFFFPHSYLNRAIVELPGGHVLMRVLRRFFPSQAGGWIAACRKTARERRG